MGTVDVYNKERMDEIIDSTLASATVDVDGNLIFTKYDETTFNAGHVKGADGDDATVPDATTTVKGKAELATDAEVIAGTATDLIVPPSGLAALTSSSSRRGIIEIATIAETTTGTDTVRAVTPATLAALVAIITPAGMLVPFSGVSAPTSWLLCDGSTVSRATYASLFSVTNAVIGTFTVTVASPGVFTATAHGCFTGQEVALTTTGALPTGLSVETNYWLIRIDANTFRLATSLANALAGTAINTSGTQSGTHSFRRTYGVGNGTTTFNLPDLRGRVIAGVDSSQAEFDALGETGGAKTHTLTATEMPVHRHVPTGGTATDLVLHNGSVGVAAGIPGAGANYRGSILSNEGGGGAHNNLQPYISLNYIIKT